ncbi:DUF2510 domain-containing protein [Agromyces allii]|uniref:DUF2510 domain-containing protein n=1 Tax=Agromyces allii TaxID=393607 RepID=A0ABN2RE08_9MICO|nr:DUF2510 domain-containing protein [Agromyces allii]
MSDAPSIPADWYPDPNNAAQLRYWDGHAWTDHYAPAVAPPTSPTGPAANVNLPAPTSAATVQFAPPTATVAPSPGTPAPSPRGASGFAGWWARLGGPAKVFLIIAAVIVGLLFVTGIGNAFRGPDQGAPVVVTVTASPEPEPETEPEPSAEAVPAPEPEVIDVPTFQTQANGHLDDMSKDLDDMVVTIDEGGFFRLLSNSVELSFNVGQLEALDIPPSVAAPYAESVAGLSASIDSMNDPIANEDNATLLVIIDTMRTQIQGMHDLVNSAT